ncbi:conjugal transfer protein TraH [Agrobacterium tumefaciens]|uniref:Conjugal transfer protein TraH n=2 Tax=Rhizobium/Agrobacterium group TaxID=227290 RepID=Q9F5D7_RHIRH|nr:MULTISPECIES: TraH family protein [Rhizobium/Agrobacterium group]ASK43004.1 conjugal transfer protein TraH [Rhizobium rhizogenes]MCZ7976334.1 TraH family protein [Agrobacterium salinitolerans]MDA5243222.1 TraH family protein [Agrobacterium sp. MAFF310724]MDA5247596.1 TraH family protein [Agrobacterium sp. MAFF210268]TRB03271.1 conjugal transfer protein TraH [Agrobacterium tumefaciens]
MLDAALIKECADPSLKPAIVEQFVASAGSADPLAVTVKSGGRLILVPKAASADEAIAIVRQYAGQAVVRVGLTQFPAGVGVKEAADLKPDLVDACQNLRKGTAMFAKVLRIVAKWYGNPTSKDVFPQIFEDAIYAWKTGEFEGVSVFQAEDPGTPVEVPRSEERIPAEEESAEPRPGEDAPETVQEVGRAGIRIDLSRIGGQP